MNINLYKKVYIFAACLALVFSNNILAKTSLNLNNLECSSNDKKFDTKLLLAPSNIITLSINKADLADYKINSISIIEKTNKPHWLQFDAQPLKVFKTLEVEVSDMLKENGSKSKILIPFSNKTRSVVFGKSFTCDFDIMTKTTF